jgi:cellobiose phosphorylase
MPNSYSYNLEAGMDGESMSDWYTGSANTLIKSLVRGLFGVNPNLDGMHITPCSYIDSKEASCSLVVKGSLVKVEYKPTNNKISNIEINGIKYDYNKDIYLDNSYINENKIINIRLF